MKLPEVTRSLPKFKLRPKLEISIGQYCQVNCYWSGSSSIIRGFSSGRKWAPQHCAYCIRVYPATHDLFGIKNPHLKKNQEMFTTPLLGGGASHIVSGLQPIIYNRGYPIYNWGYNMLWVKDPLVNRVGGDKINRWRKPRNTADEWCRTCRAWRWNWRNWNKPWSITVETPRGRRLTGGVGWEPQGITKPGPNPLESYIDRNVD